MLRITNLSKTYPNGVKALDGINLTLSHGMFGLLGPNGAGKSSLMRTIAGLQKPDSGQILFNGVDVLQQPQALHRRLGYLPQEFGVYPRLSAFRLLDHFAILKGITHKKQRREQVAAVLAQTNLEEHRHRAVSAFSGGMHRRFGIALALLGDPALIIADEPTAGLDPGERNRFHQLLARLAQDRVVMLSTHIVEDVRDLCTQAVVLVGGRIRLAGRPADLVGGLAGRVWRKAVSHDQEPAMCHRFHVISTRLHEGRLIVHVVAEKQPGPGFRQVAPDLEDAYFHVLRQCETTAAERTCHVA
ncbi:ABC transporter ATP-binding protein [Acanthopleuribacter pedis]|uniref:ABC transporter ATP-binding protein n=1 Tax=Acanthopleuribacter pedis TaxID=442870 RepID=A0A8J7U5M0_9BACT|nr:ABC transporter ATP-binding protein [Acanthopleuribacter pedis]MBO1319461.1 ABC transporter ATP-binding protein [Acanthopleuribacter pedis]